ncbi:MAG: NAD(P)/FAD-dependent oxidoreductase [Aquabacterium sp.]|nr:MAG: NAD(P)/FAD-dependent oxidoreductase [Aquabacterium sp.]
MSNTSANSSAANADQRILSAIVVGSGFSGLGMGVQLKRAGFDDFLILERAGGVGGTWRDNRYPGCACDVQSHLYSFSFEPNPGWSRMFPTQPEILAYLQRVAQKYGLMPHMRFNANVTGARYDEARALWTVGTADGRSFTARALVSGMGGLSNPGFPDIPGRESFAGASFHTAQWPDGVDLRGKRVAIIGSAASAVQVAPQLAPIVERLDYYQRTPSWVMPKPDRPMKPWEKKLFTALPFTQRLLRAGIYTLLESRVLGFTVHPKIMKAAAGMGRAHIYKHVKDPAKRKLLTPQYTPGCKRILISNDYYPALARENVQIINDAITRITPTGIVTRDGQQRDVDAIVYATGFTIQDMVPRGLISGVGGRDLLDAWPKGPEAFLGISVSGFPNMFFLMGPNTGLGHNSMVYMIESQIRYVVDALKQMRAKRLQAVDVKPQAQQAFVEETQARLTQTVWASGCNSWYLNASGRNTTLWPGFTFAYRRRTRSFKLDQYNSTRTQ